MSASEADANALNIVDLPTFGYPTKPHAPNLRVALASMEFCSKRRIVIAKLNVEGLEDVETVKSGRDQDA